MRLLLDEMLSPAIALELRARGHDVEAIAGHPGREALPAAFLAGQAAVRR